jgi:predicted transposase/invertase (TIGR01784 family)
LLNKDNLPKELDDPNLKKALNVLEVMNFTEEEREAYEDHLKWLRMEASTLKKAETTAEERGEARGRAEGRSEGKQKEKIEIAKKMIAKDKPVEEISEFTGLSKEEIEKIK